MIRSKLLVAGYAILLLAYVVYMAGLNRTCRGRGGVLVVGLYKMRCVKEMP